jgi:hypothetical protein
MDSRDTIRYSKPTHVIADLRPRAVKRLIVIARVASLVMLFHVATGTSSGPDGVELLENGNFDEWKNDKPIAWTLVTGATEGECGESKIRPGSDRNGSGHAISMSGDKSTQLWRAVIQGVDVKPGDVFHFSGWLRSVDVKREGHRYGNSQAALVAKSESGERINTWLLGPAIGTTEWTPHDLYIQAPPGCSTFEVSVFLSMSGTLECDDLSLKRLPLPGADPSASRDEKWRSDITYLSELLPKLHVNPFTMTSEVAFVSQAKEIQKSVGLLSDLEINFRLMALVASLGDAHSGVGFAERPRRMPVQFEFFGDDLRVLAVDRQCAELAGGRVTRIGRFNLEECLGALRPMIACETESWFRHMAPQVLRLAEVSYGLGFTDLLGQVEIAVIDESGAATSCILELPWLGENIQYEIREPAESKTPLYLSGNANYWYHYIEEDRTLYFQYNRCREDPQYSMEEFSRDLAIFLDAHRVERFVLDVRHNSGGSSGLLDNLISDVAERKTAGKIDRCYVITGRSTFSAAALNTLDFRKATDALVVGEPMGNKPNRFGQLNYFELPNSGLRVQYATKHFLRMDGNPPILDPDIQVSTSWEDYLEGRDPVLERILAHD